MKRSWYLSLFLILVFVYTLLNMLATAIFPSGLPGYEMPVWYAWVSVVLMIIQLIGLVLIWKWKHVGMYLFIVAALVSIVFDYIATPDKITLTLLGTLIPVVIIYFCARPVWKNFK